ncbi:unnamed protein product, partial [Ectocarpus sp. 6 AP-2014]
MFQNNQNYNKIPSFGVGNTNQRLYQILPSLPLNVRNYLKKYYYLLFSSYNVSQNVLSLQHVHAIPRHFASESRERDKDERGETVHTYTSSDPPMPSPPSNTTSGLRMSTIWLRK